MCSKHTWQHQQPFHDSWPWMSCCFLSACECKSNAAVNRKKANEKTPLETISNSFKHFRPGWWFAFIWRVTCHFRSWCTSITLRTLVHSSMQRPAKSCAIRWGSREKHQPNTITSSKRKSQNAQIIWNINKTYSIYIISCEELLGLTARQEETIAYSCKTSEKPELSIHDPIIVLWIEEIEDCMHSMCPLDRRHRSWNLTLHLQGWFFHWHSPKDPLQDQVWQDSTSKNGVHPKQGKHRATCTDEF